MLVALVATAAVPAVLGNVTGTTAGAVIDTYEKEAAKLAVPAIDEVADGVFNAAVNVKAVENLFLEIGAFIDTADKSDKVIVLFASYRGIEKVGLNLSGKVTLAGADDADNTINVGVAGTYDLGDGMGVVGDVRVQYVDEAAIAFLAGFEKGFSNGKIGIGFQGAANGCGLTTISASEADSFQFAVPVKVEYWF